MLPGPLRVNVESITRTDPAWLLIAPPRIQAKLPRKLESVTVTDPEPPRPFSIAPPS